MTSEQLSRMRKLGKVYMINNHEYAVNGSSLTIEDLLTMKEMPEDQVLVWLTLAGFAPTIITEEMSRHAEAYDEIMKFICEKLKTLTIEDISKIQLD